VSCFVALHRLRCCAVFAYCDLGAQVVSLNLASNGITTLRHFEPLHRHLPKLINLSLENNCIGLFSPFWIMKVFAFRFASFPFPAGIEELRYLRALKLQEIVLRGNPVAQSMPPDLYLRLSAQEHAEHV